MPKPDHDDHDESYDASDDGPVDPVPADEERRIREAAMKEAQEKGF